MEKNIFIENNRVSIGSLILLLKDHLKWLAFFIACGTVIGLTVGLFSTRYQSAKAVIAPIPADQLDSLNRAGIYKISPQDALWRVADAFNSYESRFNFFKENPELFNAVVSDRSEDGLREGFEYFDEYALSMLVPKGSIRDGVTQAINFYIRYPEDLKGADLLNGFVEYILSQEKYRIGIDIQSVVGNRLNELESQLLSQRARYEYEKQSKIATLVEASAIERIHLQDELVSVRKDIEIKKMNRILELGEAIAVADRLNIINPVTPTDLAARSGSTQQSVAVNLDNEREPLFFMGRRVLEAEKKVLEERIDVEVGDERVAKITSRLAQLENNREVEILKSRINEDYFLPDVAKLYSEIALLKSFKIDMSSINLVKLDRKAFDLRKRPNFFWLIGMLLGAGLGCVLGSISIVVYRRLLTQDGMLS